MQFFHSENYPIVLPEGHHFPIQKYALVREQLEFEGLIRKSQLQSPELIDEATILLTHDPAFWARAKQLQLTAQESRRIGFPQCEELIARSIASASGTLRASQCALGDGAGMNLAGGTHHAFFDRGEGFCLLNDIAISINFLLHTGAIRRALVIDLDVHQGNGTAALFRNRPEVFTFSMHCGDNYPFWKEQSDLDIELPGGIGDEAYLGILQSQIPRLLEEVKPDIVYYLAGVDVLAGDRLGRLGLSLQGCYERDKWVISHCHSYLLPLVIVMGGGYHTNLNQLVRAHAATFRLGIEHYEKNSFYISR